VKRKDRDGDRPKLRKTLLALTELADQRFSGNLVIRKDPDGWLVYFASPKALQSEMGLRPLPTFAAAAGRAIAHALMAPELPHDQPARRDAGQTD
jgi:hypothetical protein